METPTALVTGAILTIFGGALLLWCAAEVRLRHRLRRHGIAATARVVADSEAETDWDGELDSAPLLAYATLPPADSATGRGEKVLARPRGHTPLRRPSGLVPGHLVRVAYDPRRPSRVILAAPELPLALPSDLVWAVLGASLLATGLSVLALFR